MSQNKTATQHKLRDTTARSLWRFMSYAKPYRAWIIGACIAGLVRMVLPLYMPIFVKNVIDRTLVVKGLSIEGRLQVLWSLLPVLGFILVLHVGATLGRVFWGNLIGVKAVRDIRHHLFDHVQRLSLEFHAERPTGSIVARVMNDVSTAQTSFDLIFIQAAQNILQSIVITGYLFYRDWQWALASLATLPLFIITTVLLKNRVREASRQVLESNSRVTSYLSERMQMVREVQSFTAEDYERRRIKGRVRLLHNHALRQYFLSAVLLASSEITRTLGLVVMLIFGVYRVLSGHATIGDVTAFYLYTGMMLMPVEFFSNLYANLQSSAVAADRVCKFFDATPAVHDAPDAKPLQVRRPPEIRFENVTFAYPDEPENPILRNVTVQVEPGWRVVLVGGSGSGKSTLMNLLLRFYDPQQGCVLIDNQDIRSITTHSLRQTIGIVPQNPMLFRGSVRENILYGRRDGGEKEMREAARLANAEQFILELPQGYDTLVGERGVGLSGGQVQRIAIARAFLKDPSILILDEATSNLDATSEALVLEALDRLAEGRTTFIIAHRLSVARTADLIVDMHNGEVVEQGQHEDLIENGSAYRELWEQQMAVSIP